MYEQLLILSTAIAAITLVRLARRFDPGQRGYFFVVGGVLVAACWGLIGDDRFIGVTAIALCGLTIVVPWLLEAVARMAFGRGRLKFAVWLAGVRAVLMPGSGLGRQQEILRGLALLERDGVDAALQHFRNLADETEDGGELALIHEQIVAMLFYGGRWDEGIAHYEGQFHPAYASVRPSLALGLLRAYGESGKLLTAAALLRALEEGPIGADRRAVATLCQARLTFLAYTGSVRAVEDALTNKHLPLLGITPASGALFRGIASAKAGDPQRAQRELERVEQLAGPADSRTVDASKVALAGMPADPTPIDLEPEVKRYAERVADRVHRFLAGAEVVRRTGPLVATPIFLGLVLLGYVASVWWQGTGMGLLRVGALTPQLWHADSWGRLLTGLLVQGNVIGLLISVYGLWLGGPVIERLMGSARLVWVAVVGGVAGLLASVWIVDRSAAVLAGSQLTSFAVVAAALWTLLPVYTPRLAARSRRTLAIPLGLVAVVHGLALVPGLVALHLSPLGFGVAAVTGIAVVGIVPATPWKPLQVALRWGAWLLLVPLAWAGWQVAGEDVEAFVTANREPVETSSGVTLQLPATFAVIEGNRDSGFALPVYDGYIDTLEARTNHQVQVLVVPETEIDGPSSSALLALDPELRRELDVVARETVPEPLRIDGLELRMFGLRRNGEIVGQTVERPVPGASARVVLLAAPAEAWVAAPALYRSILTDARASGSRGSGASNSGDEAGESR